MIVFHFVPTNHSVRSQAAAPTLSCPIWSTTLFYYGAICNCQSFYLHFRILNIFRKYASQLHIFNSKFAEKIYQVKSCGAKMTFLSVKFAICYPSLQANRYALFCSLDSEI